jgi:hypothetical protein
MDQKEAARIMSRMAGLARKAQDPDYSALGKKGMASRWKGHVKKPKVKKKGKSDN